MSEQSLSRTVAVIGLGVMGGRAAIALTSRFRVRGFDPVLAARSRAAAAGVDVFESATEAARGADAVLLSLPTPQHVHAVIDDLVTTLDGALVIDMSTIDPTTARAAAETLAAHGSRYVDSPILGRPDRCGAWVAPIGGSESDVAAAEEVVVGTIAKAVEHVGDVGTGSALKILNNLMFGAINAVTAEAIYLAEATGLDAERFVTVIAESGAATVSPLFRDIGPKMAASDFAPTFSLDLLLKDITLANELARSIGSEATMTDEVLRLTKTAVDRGLGASDTSAIINLYRTPEESTSDSTRNESRTKASDPSRI